MSMMDFKGPGFHLQVPTDWYIMSSPQFQAMFIAPPSKEKMRANLMITLRPLEPEVTAESIFNLSKETQEKEYAEYEVIKEEEVTTNIEEKGFQRYYRWFNKENQTRVLQRQVMYVFSDMLVTLTATRPDTEKGKALDPIFEHMVQTFKFNI